jgi:hypothetical protein
VIDELPPELRDLIAAERRTVASPTIRSAVRAKVGATVGKAAVGASIGAGAIKIISIIALIATGAGVARLASSDDRAHAAVPVVAMATGDSIAEPDPSTTTAAFEAMPVATPAAPRPPITRPATESEAAHLGRALRALSLGDASTALALVDEHRVLYPSGTLSEERDAIAVRALALLGRVSAARTSATRFLADYPDSVHVDAIRTIQTGTLEAKETSP